MAAEVPFRELLLYAVGGGWGAEQPASDRIDVRVIRGTDFANIAAGNFDQVPRRFESCRKAERRLLAPNDIVLEISGGSRTSNQSTGRTLLVTQELLDQLGERVIPASFCRLIRVQRNVVAPTYAYYALQEMYHSGRATMYEHHSTGISNFQFEYFLDQELVRLPPLSEQHSIAEILGTLDKKSELNRSMSDTLEKMARTLYKSWFVEFDPVHAHVEGRETGLPDDLANLFPDSFVDANLGECPSGWTQTTWGDVVTLQYGKSIRGYGEESGPYPVYGTNGRIGSWSEPLCTHAGIIVGRKGAYRGIHFCDEPFYVIDTAFYVEPKEGVQLRWAYYQLLREDINGMDSGSAIPSTSRAEFHSLPVICPPVKLQAAFVRVLEPLWARQRHCTLESRTLAALRDTLLPKLISGELRIRDAERFVAAAV